MNLSGSCSSLFVSIRSDLTSRLHLISARPLLPDSEVTRAADHQTAGLCICPAPGVLCLSGFCQLLRLK